MRYHFLIYLFLVSGSSFAQVKNNLISVQGIWIASKSIIDPKVGIIKLARVTHDGPSQGTFLWFKDTSNVRLYFSPMCGNDCIWDYEGKYVMNSTNKLTLKFETYTQHGFCKSLSKSYKKEQMKFIFLAESAGKDTLVLKRQTK